MTDPKQLLRYPDIVAEGIDDWPFFLERLHARFKTGSFVKGLDLVTRITEAAEAANHHPDVVLTYPQVDVTSPATTSAASPAATSTWPGRSRRSPPSWASSRRRVRCPRSSWPSTSATRPR